MVRSITKNTVLCMSLAGRPSNIGTRFHNFLYAELDLDFVYKAFTTTDLAAAIAGIRALGIRGCGVSMPYKEACIELMDELDGSAAAIGSVNTIVNTGGRLRAYNTDYLAIAKLLVDHQVPVDHTFAVLGSGGMAKAVIAALRDAGFHGGTVVARNARTGPPWPTSTATPGGPSLAPASHSCWSTRPRSGCRVGPPPTTCRWRPRWWTPPRRSWTWSPCRR
jgi:shikimate dehydrogenase